MAHKLNIVLSGSEPKIYRKVIVPEKFTFDQLHEVIQIVMGWENYHMYQFNLGAPYNSDKIGLPNEDDEDFGLFGGKNHENYDATQTYLSDILTPLFKKKLSYTYDFGDDWHHEIKILAKPTEDVLFPICIDGANAGPTEDCGGIYGFYDMLETINSPKKSDEKTEFMEWLGLRKGEKYDEIFAFDKEEINAILLECFKS